MMKLVAILLEFVVATSKVWFSHHVTALGSLSPAEVARVKDFMGDTVALDSGGAWERELAYAAAVLAEPDDTGMPLDLSRLDARLDALDGT